MDECIVTPIGLVMGIITTYTKKIVADLDISTNHKIVRQGCLYRKFHLPIQGRSPPLGNI